MIKKILTVLGKHPDIHAAYIFGTTAQCTEKPESDLDLAVQSAAPLTTEQQIILIEDLALATSRSIDLMDLKTAREPVLGEILKGLLLLGSNVWPNPTDSNQRYLKPRHPPQVIQP